MYFISISLISADDDKPTDFSFISPPTKTISVGMLEIPYYIAVFSHSSTLTLTTFALPAISGRIS